MQEMPYPTSYLKSKGLGKQCALLTDGHFSGGTSGLSIGRVSPEAAAGGAIALVEQGDIIRIDISQRIIDIVLSDAELKKRRDTMETKGPAAWQPLESRSRNVSTALKAYAKLTTSADKGAERRLFCSSNTYVRSCSNLASFALTRFKSSKSLASCSRRFCSLPRYVVH